MIAIGSSLLIYLRSTLYLFNEYNIHSLFIPYKKQPPAEGELRRENALICTFYRTSV